MHRKILLYSNDVPNNNNNNNINLSYTRAHDITIHDRGTGWMAATSGRSFRPRRTRRTSARPVYTI